MILKKSYEIDWVDAQFVFFLNKVSLLEKTKLRAKINTRQIFDL
jgi:hypothetical protein